MTGELIDSDFRGGVLAEIRSLRAEVEQLKRSGFAREAAGDGGSLLTMDQAAKIESVQSFSGADQILVGTGVGSGSTVNIGSNSLVGRSGSAAIGGISVSADSVIGRSGTAAAGSVTAAPDSAMIKQGSGSVGFAAASASQILAMLSTGSLGFQSRTSLVQDMDILVGEAWEFDAITTSQTLTEGKMGGVMNNTTDVTVTLPTPANGGAVFFVHDPLGRLGSSARVRFAGAGASDQINGSTSPTAQFGAPYGLFIFFGALSGGNAHWVFKIG